jgi:hypothetical protein
MWALLLHACGPQQARSFGISDVIGNTAPLPPASARTKQAASGGEAARGGREGAEADAEAAEAVRCASTLLQQMRPADMHSNR